MHTEFCLRESPQPEQVANFYQQWDSSSAEKVIKPQCLRHLGEHFQDITSLFLQQAASRPHKWEAQARGDLNLSHHPRGVHPPTGMTSLQEGRALFLHLQSCTGLLPLLWQQGHPGLSSLQGSVN